MSRYYLWRNGADRFLCKRWPKLSLVCLSQTQFLPGAVVSWGPSHDSGQFMPVLEQAARIIHFDRILADAAYDAEHNHVFCRQRLGIRSTVIPVYTRRSKTWPRQKYRRQMKKRFFKQIYHQRWQVESAISRNKRLLGSDLKARKWSAQKDECLYRVLTHNLLLLKQAPSDLSTEHHRGSNLRAHPHGNFTRAR